MIGRAGPPQTLEERLKHALLPPGLYMRWRAAKEQRRGESEIRLLPMLADRARVSLDIGANKGVYAYCLSRLSRHVIAFEPNPKLYAVLQRLTRPDIETFRYAISDRTGRATLRIPRTGTQRYSNQGASLSAFKVSGPHMPVEVDAYRLDDLAIRDVGFIKIDVEGHEASVIEGARETLARDRPTLLIEIEERHTGTPIESSLAAVEKLGYRALFLRRGTLTDIAAFDPERHHRACASADDYVYNFIFLPTGR